ncbi:hypothetical protein [Caballeronia sordidicola]|uniref:hypothetical protein n=1 Tax=Caballeronia sordidicola TaxID=196367 RepID=UPI000553B27A|nr:hypothetical protein [Caballeronia sordidicola]
MRHYGNAKLGLAQQWMRLRAANLEGGTGYVRRSELAWDCFVRPSPLGRNYHVRLRYKLGNPPRVTVISPNLTSLAPDRRLPHVYYATTPLSLCLYLPGSGEWDPSKSLAETIVPWIAVWLFYFEDWLLTDDWKGGGKHPGDL